MNFTYKKKYLKYKEKYMILKNQLGGFEINDYVIINDSDSKFNNIIGKIIDIDEQFIYIQHSLTFELIKISKDKESTLLSSNKVNYDEQFTKTHNTKEILENPELKTTIEDIIHTINNSIENIQNFKDCYPDIHDFKFNSLEHELNKYKDFAINIISNLKEFTYNENKELSDEISDIFRRYQIKKAMHMFDYKDQKNQLLTILFFISYMINNINILITQIINIGNDIIKYRKSINEVIMFFPSDIPCLPYFIDLLIELIDKIKIKSIVSNIPKNIITLHNSTNYIIPLEDMKEDGGFSNFEYFEKDDSAILESLKCFRKMICNNKINCYQDCKDKNNFYNITNYKVFLEYINIYNKINSYTNFEEISDYLIELDLDLLPNPDKFKDDLFCCYDKPSILELNEPEYGTTCIVPLYRSISAPDNIQTIINKPIYISNEKKFVEERLKKFKEMHNSLKKKKISLIKLEEEFKITTVRTKQIIITSNIKNLKEAIVLNEKNLLEGNIGMELIRPPLLRHRSV